MFLWIFFTMRWAIYRIHYGTDFLFQSIDSILDSVDKVFVIYSLNPWVVKDTVNYLGNEIVMPKLHENVREFMFYHFNGESKISLLQREFSTPLNQFRIMYDMCVDISPSDDPEFVLFMEPDMVFYKPDVGQLFKELLEATNAPCVGTNQIELWKNKEYRIPERKRIGPMIWHLGRAPNFSTHFGTWHPQYQIVTDKIKNYNFGFCLSEKTMLYKHLAAINFSDKIGDSIPSQEWYVDKWLNWTPETTDLEISAAHKHFIPKAEPFRIKPEINNQVSSK